MKIIPATKKYDNVEGVRRISYCYLHGQLQDDAGYDIFGFLDFPAEIKKDELNGERYIDAEMIKEGIYPCEFERKPCTFFYWLEPSRPGGHGGLVVYDDDIESYEYAKECYESKEACL